MRTFIWCIYFCGYLLFHLPALYRGYRAKKAGNIAKADAIAEKYLSRWFWKLLELSGAEVTVFGKENLPKEPCVFIANHRGTFDVPLMMTQLGKCFPMISKIELKKIPIIHEWVVLLHYLYLDRSNPRQGMQVIDEAVSLIEKGYSIGIFPEGTRYKGKEGEVGVFMSGAFRIASKSRAPIVPIAIRNSRACLEGNGRLKITPAKITMTILPQIDTAGMSRGEIKTLPEVTRQQILDALNNTRNF